MKFLFFIRPIIYISLEFFFAYGLEKSRRFYRKFFYILAVSIIILEIIKIKKYTSDFWDRQALGFLIGYNLYFFIKVKTKKD
ncbi:hypothetical protein [uncultured Peptoniphilus sp.]|mgnify:CR=1 FL=1|uniref:hypothetical protein n=1 Tax=uncultured Peptoniphilus sp. TaxID=254354 RepID=UPI0025D262B0|nr:hypothetical protein [uncultured Peptoniphilus sp.]